VCFAVLALLLPCLCPRNWAAILLPKCSQPWLYAPAEAEFRAYHLLSLMGQHGKFKGDQQGFLSMLQVSVWRYMPVCLSLKTFLVFFHSSIKKLQGRICRGIPRQPLCW
jgi:hypothetical protein